MEDNPRKALQNIIKESDRALDEKKRRRQASKTEKTKQAESVLINSLSRDAPGTNLIAAIIVTLGIALAPVPYIIFRVCGGSHDIAWELILIGGGAVIGCIAMLYPGKLIAGFHAAREKKWLIEIPYRFNREDYLRELSEMRSSVHLTLRIFFTNTCASETQSLFIESIRALMPELPGIRFPDVTSLVDDSNRNIPYSVLELVSQDGEGIETVRSFGRTGLSKATFLSNGHAHRCFRDIVKKVLPRIHAVQPIDHLDIFIAGDVLEGRMEDLLKEHN